MLAACNNFAMFSIATQMLPLLNIDVNNVIYIAYFSSTIDVSYFLRNKYLNNVYLSCIFILDTTIQDFEI